MLFKIITQNMKHYIFDALGKIKLMLYSLYIIMEDINTIVCEGGGINGIAYIGAFKELQSRINFNKIKYLCGTAVGSIFVFALALGL